MVCKLAQTSRPNSTTAPKMSTRMGREVFKGESGVSPMCPVQTVTHVLGRSLKNSDPVLTHRNLTRNFAVASTEIAQLGSLTVSSTVSGGTPGGSVQFTVDGVQAGTLVPVNSGTTGPVTLDAASAPSLSTVVGTHMITAHYTGSATTQPSQSGTLKVTVTGITSLPITGTSSTTSGSGNISLTIN